MMKKAKIALLLVLALVFALQCVGMPAAKADVISKLTVDYIFDGLGDALNYGVVAEEYNQSNHAETSVFVDKLVKVADTPFLNTETTYMYGRAYPLYATVSAPTGKSLKGMMFALFTANGSEMTMCEDTLTTIEEDTNVAAVGWRLDEDSPYLLHGLYVRQVEKNAAGGYRIINENEWNSASLQVTYGPDISTAAPSSSYIGSMESDVAVGSSIKFYNTMAHNPPVEFGPGARLCLKKYRWVFSGNPMDPFKQEEAGYLDVTAGRNSKLPYGEMLDESGRVYIQYTDSEGKTQYAQFEDKIRFEPKLEMAYGYTAVSGSFYFEENGKKNYLEITSTNEDDKAAKLLKKARAFSQELGNMKGGVVKYEGNSIINAEPSILGNSTMTGPEDANGNIVSLYTVHLNDWAFNEKALRDSIGQEKILIAPNEYVVFNVVCDEKTGYVDMLPNSLDMYIYEAGKADQALWGKEDSGASDRVLFNFVYLDGNTYKPFEGTINPTSQHGGTVLAPSAHIDVNGDPPNGSLIGKTIINRNGTEIHQRTMTSPAQTTWVNMVGRNAPKTGEIKLVKKQGTTLENLSGATFAVYSDKACTKKVGADKTTDAQGVAIFKDLKPGTYYVKEVKAPEGYALDNTVHTVEVRAGVTALVGTKGYVTNTSGRGALTLTKVDADDTSIKLAGAKFGLYTCKGDTFNQSTAKLVQTLTTNSSGKITVRVEAGDYWIKEIEAPFGYDIGMSQAKKITVKADETTVVATSNGFVTNEKRPTGTLKVTKVDLEDATKKLDNAEFAVYMDSSCKKQVATFKTANGGVAALDLPIGTYWVKEITAPNGYVLDSATKYEATIKAGQITELGKDGVVTNEIIKAEVFLLKVGLETDPYGNINYGAPVSALAGAEFTVYNNAACGEDNIVTSGLTDESGKVTFKLAPGQYWFKETKAPLGYTIRDTQAKEVYVNAGGEPQQIRGEWNSAGFSGAFANTKKSGTGSLVLYKVDAETKQKQLNGAEFMIYNDEACTDPVTKQVFVTKDVGKHTGRLDIEGLEPGTYYLREEKAPSGYVLPSPNLPIKVTIEKDKTTRVNGEHGVVTNEALKQEWISVSVTKVWEGGEPADADLTDCLELYAKGTETDALIDAKPVRNGNSYTWNNLPKNDDKGEITYIVKEATVPAGYQVSYANGLNYAVNNGTITNTYEAVEEKTEITVTKAWVGDETVKDTVRPASITVTLKMGNATHDTAAVLNEANNWTFTWKDLPVEENGEEIQYQVVEDAMVPGYTTAYSGNAAEGFVITNTYEAEEEKTEITVTKVWVGDEAVKDTVRPASITVTLLVDTGAYDTVAVLNEANNWTFTWKDLPVKENGVAIQYEVIEDAMVPGYTTAYSGNAAEGFVITNTYESQSAETLTNLSVEKIWEDNNNAAGARPESITVKLLANGAEYDSVQLDESSGWGYVWDALPAVGTDGNPITYTLEEAAVPGYTATIRQSAEDLTRWSITNTYLTSAVQFSAAKVLVGAPLQDGQFTFQLKDMAGNVLQTKTNNAQGSIIFDPIAYALADMAGAATDDEGIQEKQINYTISEVIPAGAVENDDGTYSLDSITYDGTSHVVTAVLVNNPQTGEMTVLAGYNTEDGSAPAFTNICTENQSGGADGEAVQTSITVTKVWNDNNNAGGLRPESVWVTLMQNGVELNTQTLTEGCNWTYTWEALDAFDDEGNPYDYTVEEELLPDYTAEYSGDAVNGFVITNTRIRETTYLNVRKIWEDNNNAAQARPESITLILLANGEEYAYAEVSESSGWEYCWADLPRTDEAGKVIEYTVSEKPVPGYVFTTVQGVVNLRYWNVVNTYVGEDKLGVLMLCKSDRLNSDKKLAGAEYTLFTKETCKEEEILVLPNGAKAVITTGANGWGTLTGVPAGSYWVKETKAPAGYEVDPVPYKVEVKADPAKPVQVQVSDFPLRGALSLSKTVVADSKTGENFLFDIVLSRTDSDPIVGSYEATLNGAAAEKVSFTADGKNAKATVSLKDGETLVIHGLRAGTTYTVTEQPNALYDVQVNGMPANSATGTISNAALAVAKFQNTLKLVSFTVKKEWTGLDEGEKTPAIKLTLYCNGKAYPAVTPAPDKNGWYTFTGLPAYVDGKLAVYTVKEEPVTGFTTTYLNKGENAAVTDCAHNGSTIVNSKIPQTGDSTPLTMWMLTALLAAFGLVGATVALRKREN